MNKPSASKKRAAAKKPASSGKARKPAAKATPRSSAGKAAAARPAAEPARPVERYQPRQIEGIGWKPFRYPPE
ncbi:MAG: hypothetical protein DMD81_14000 [Candidatus Rokuibacteriota bacterium]|nr:MAG: hypothetical protein DMD81_14000 [Candidatus Rokubacteria bacterium]